MHFSVSKQSNALQGAANYKFFRQSFDKILFFTHLSLPHDGLAAGVPVPEQHGAVLAPAHDVAIAGVVTLGPGERGI